MPSVRTLARSGTLALALFALPGAVLAQGAPPLPGQADVSRVAAGTYAADPAHSLISWTVNHLGLSDYFGLFGSITGTLTLDPKNPAADKVSVTIPVSKVLTANEHLTAHLLRAPAAGAKPDFFGPNPADATFVSTSVVPVAGSGADGKSATITGTLTLNGVSKPVTVAAKFVGAGTNPLTKKDTVGFSGTATIKRSDFGVSAFVPFVSDEVQLTITVAFEKAA